MLKEQAQLFTKIAVTADLLVLFLSYFFAFHTRNLSGSLGEFTDYLWVLLAIIPVWYYLMVYFRLYAPLRTRKLNDILASILKVHVVGGIITASIIYLVNPYGLSRGFYGYFLCYSFLFISAEKTALKQFLHFIRRKGYNYHYILIAGTNDKGLRLAELVEHHKDWGLRVAGFLSHKGETSNITVGGYDVLGTLQDVLAVCKSITVDEVVFCLEGNSLDDIEGYIKELQEIGVTVRMVLDFYNNRAQRSELSYFHDELPMLTFYCKPFDAGQLFLKRCLDLIGATVGLLGTIILFPAITMAIKLDSKGPLLFGQNRVGANGRIFTCWKFRSMYIDAEERKQDLMAQNEMKGAMFKMKNDPRITRVGSFLRKTSLDELPQFWNVFKGEMSLVGTRPPTPDEVANYENWHRKRICIKPGITGLWQVSGRNQIQDFDEVVRLDIEYIERWTLWLDIKILLKTFWVVFARSGSC